MTSFCSVQLNDSKVPWFVRELPDLGLVVWGRGYAFLEGSYHENEGLVAEVASRCRQPYGPEQIHAFKRLVPVLNGCWALVVRGRDGTVLAAVDRSRSVPLFYALTDCGYLIAASAEDIAREVRNPEISLASAAEYMLSGYISGRDTLYKGIQQVQAAELVEFHELEGKPAHTCQFYFRYYSDDPEEGTQEHFGAKLSHILEEVFARHAAALRDKPLVLPLSAGYDSRLIAWMLRKNGINDVLCYTYGAAANPQREIAQRVARDLGYRWQFVEYNAATWAQAIRSPEMEGYLSYAFRGVSSPHIQDFPAIARIVDGQRFGSRPVFLPGHVGDAWASEFVLTHLQKRALHPPSEYHSRYYDLFPSPVVSAIVYRHLNLWPVAPRLWRSGPLAEVVRKILGSIDEYDGNRGERFRFVEWILRNRTATWIVNSCRCFEYFGGGYALTLGDYAIIDFFRRLPLDLLLDRGLYAHVAQRILHDPDCIVRDVPVRSGGTRPPKIRRWIIDRLVDSGIYKPLDRLRRPFRTPRSLCAESWFTKGRPPEEVTVGEALASQAELEHLPDELRTIVAPFLSKPAYSIQCNGLLAASWLMRLFSDHKRAAAGAGRDHVLVLSS